ncbi:hypothetical protein M5C99_20670 [Acidovorax sp. NCPPB 2350]|nr:hypothetical protein M5C99_20670 [Acidovorax sp. NCPPB 2350]
MTIQRTLIAPQYVNSPHAWRIADEATRLSLALSDADIYKYALQLDNLTEWMLIDINPPAWQQRGGGFLSALQYPEVSITGTATLAFGRMYICSGTTTDYTVTLPPAAGNAGSFIGIRMAPSLTRWVTVKGNASELIDGVNTRKMWANEVAILMCDGNAWVKVAGKSIPVNVAMKRTTAQAVPALVWTAIATTTVTNDNTSGLSIPCADTANGRFTVPRNGNYLASGYVSIDLNANGSLYGGVALNASQPGDNPNAWGMGTTSASAWVTGSANFTATAGQYITTIAYSGLARNTVTLATALPTLSVIEQIMW